MQEDQDLSVWTQGPHKNLTTSRPSNARNGIHHQQINDITHEPHHPTTNQDIKTSTSITSIKRISNQRSTKMRELDYGFKWDQGTS